MRIKEKIDEIKGLLNELESIIPNKFKEYKPNKTVKAACERYFERIIEGITDISFMIIKQKKFEIPEDDINSFSILADHKIISKEICQKLKEAKGMRNILTHQYGNVNDKTVYDAIKEELGKDINNFIQEVKKFL